MSFTNHRHSASVEGVYYDEGLRSYMVRVFNYMAIALGITGVTAYFVSSSASLLTLIYQTPLQWVLMFAPLIFVFVFAAKIPSMQLDTAKMLFWTWSLSQ